MGKGNMADECSAAGDWSDHFEKSIRTESTRAKVVLSACYLEELLHQIIAIMLYPVAENEDPFLEGPQAPLNSISAKIDLAWRMGVIPDDTRASLHLVRKIRNRFVHSLATCDFEDPKIRSWNSEFHKLNDHATAERRATFSDGPGGDFEKSLSWLVFWLEHIIQTIPSTCPQCGSDMEHRAKIKAAKPGEHG